MLKRLQDVPQFEVAEGSPDVRGWGVVDRNHRTLGKVDSLIIDEDTAGSEGLTPVRYLGIQSDGSIKMVPIGTVNIDESAHEVVLTRDDYTSLDRLPTFQQNETPERDRGYFTTFFPGERDINYRRPEFEHRSERLHLIEEKLKVGKREKQVGEAVARKRTEMRPAEETVQLRKEHVEVERHPVNKPLADTDFAATGGRALESEREIRMPIMGEEAVVQKTPFVKEEVTLRKETETESKTVREQVKSEELEFAGTEPTERDLQRRDATLGRESTEKEGLGDKIKRKLDL